MNDTIASALRRVDLDNDAAELCSAAADEIDTLRAHLAALQAFAGTLAVHVKGHFAMATQASQAICLQWAENVQQQIDKE